MPFDQKITIAQSILENPLILQNLKINIIFSFTTSSFFPPIILLMYSIYCSYLLFHKNPDNNQTQKRKFKIKKITFIWQIYLVAVISLLSVANIYFCYTFSITSAILFLEQIILFQTILVSSIPISLIFFPQILYGFTINPRLDMVYNLDKKSMKTLSSHDINLEELSNRIYLTMKRDKNFLSNEFSLDHLVTLLGVPKYHVYTCLNEVMKVRFSDLLAQYRVEYAKELLLDLDKKNLTIEAIGIESGFSTRSSFYRAFKLHTGLTPKEFIHQYEIYLTLK